MKILGFHYSELATATIMIDGEIVACVSEERFTRRKNDMIYPKKSIEYCLEEADMSGKDLDIVAFPSIGTPFADSLIKRFSDFPIQDYVREQSLLSTISEVL